MKLHLEPQITPPDTLIKYTDKLLFTGSCFSEHIADALQRLKFSLLQNPHGILYNPVSIAGSLIEYINKRVYNENDIIESEGLWFSWNHHGRFSGVDKNQVLKNINDQIAQAHEFLKNAQWLVITTGTAFSYQLINNSEAKFTVANCHKQNSSSFKKQMLEINVIQSSFDNCFHRLRNFNPELKIILTVSPVKHLKDGIVENNHSKSRLIEASHHLANKFEGVYYFPSYEIVTDVLRDYRFYEKDLAHPNSLAVEYVLEQFIDNYFQEDTQVLMQEVKSLVDAASHRPLHPETKAWENFKKASVQKLSSLQKKYPWMDFTAERKHFNV